MSLLLIVIVLVLLFGVGGYRYGGPTNGPIYGGGLVGILLLILLLLYLFGGLGRSLRF